MHVLSCAARGGGAALCLIGSLALGACGEGGADFDSITALVHDQPYSRLVVEVDVMEGAQPVTGVAPELELSLQDVLNKPRGIEVVFDETLPARPDDYAWTDDELADLLRHRESLSISDDTIRIHTLFLLGRAADSDSTLGQSWAPHNVVMFKDRITQACTVSASSCYWAEHYVWLHEIGHLLGLVNFGTRMQTPHEDLEHPNHCDEPNCVMNWAYEGASEEVMNISEADVANRFGPLCQQDLEAVQEGAAAVR